jgi:hypothetical protein
LAGTIRRSIWWTIRPQEIDTSTSHLGFRCVVRDRTAGSERADG